MVNAVILSCVFDEHHLFDCFDHADGGLVALRVGADFAHGLVGNVMALFAILDIFAHFADGRYKFVGIGRTLAEDMQSHTESRFASDAW